MYIPCVQNTGTYGWQGYSHLYLHNKMLLFSHNTGGTMMTLQQGKLYKTETNWLQQIL